MTGKQTPPLAKAASTESVEESGNAFVLVASKRLRTLRKRMAKIEKYEEDIKSGAHQLNADQLQAVEKKYEVAMLIKELEDLVKQMEEKDAEESKLARKQKKFELNERNKAIAKAVEECETRYSTGVQALVKTLLTFTSILPQVPSTIVGKRERDLVAEFAATFCGVKSADALVEFQPELERMTALALSFIAQSHANFDGITSAVETAVEFYTTPVIAEPEYIAPAQPAVDHFHGGLPTTQQHHHNNVMNQHHPHHHHPSHIPVSAPIVRQHQHDQHQQQPNLTFMTPSVLADPAIVSTGASFYRDDNSSSEQLMMESSDLKTQVSEVEQQFRAMSTPGGDKEAAVEKDKPKRTNNRRRGDGRKEGTEGRREENGDGPKRQTGERNGERAPRRGGRGSSRGGNSSRGRGGSSRNAEVAA